ncbi:MAG: DegV family protein [Chloroflexi bacterium]|nr:DegV family protein [Chloroflexota bacterium]MBI5051827.1 DegV family protein [Chloroflexota bacterium]MBI5349928.1 DegV family protein [Chloroflexota bacterium]MBI5715930.1 DegV family protein [Chloroflexota bacterium]
MPKVAIVTDSTVDLPEELAQQYNIHIAPQQIIWGTETYRDRYEMKPLDFYERLKTSKENPRTSQASPGTLKEVYQNALKNADALLVIILSSGLSQTYNSAMLAKNDLPDAKIEVVDTRVISMAMGYMCLVAARMLAEGKSLEEAKTKVENMSPLSNVVFTVDTLDYLHRGGRIGGAQRFIGNALNFKPVLNVKDGKVDALERVRTKKKAVEYIINFVAERTANKGPVHLAAIHANAESEAKELLEAAKSRIQPVEALVTSMSPAIGTHTGPGTVGLAYSIG